MLCIGIFTDVTNSLFITLVCFISAYEIYVKELLKALVSVYLVVKTMLYNYLSISCT